MKDDSHIIKFPDKKDIKIIKNSNNKLDITEDFELNSVDLNKLKLVPT